MEDKINRDGLGLSLSLGQPSLPLDLMLSAPQYSMQLQYNAQNQKSSSSSWNELLQSSDRSSETSLSIGGIDINRAPPPTTIYCDEELGASSPNSTISSTSGKRSEREANINNGEENDGERACSSRGGSDEEDGGGRKKLRLSKEQAAVLEETFKEHNTLNPKQKLALAKELNLRPRQVEVWFQNRRARTKLKQTEVDCEYLRRCCENLTEENRRLQKEVHELRTLKFSPQFYMQMNPPTTLTMCPSCERVALASSSSPSTFLGASANGKGNNTLTALAIGTGCQNPIRPVPLNPSWTPRRFHAGS